MNFFNRQKGDFNNLLSEAKERYSFRNEGGTAEIEIYDEIDDWWGYGVREMAFNLNQAKGKDVLAKIHSMGGMVTEGFGVRNTLLNHSGKVTTLGIGLVASIATVILLTGEEVQMNEDAWFMIHNPFGGMIGEAEDMRKTADLLDKMRDQIANVYLQKIKSSGKMINGSEEETLNQINTWMSNETWFTAKEALEHGFIDSVIEVENKPKISNYTKGQFWNSYKNIPNQFLNNEKKEDMGFLSELKNFINQHENSAKSEETPQEETTEQEEMTVEAATKFLEEQGMSVTDSSEEGETTEEANEETEAEEDNEELLNAQEEIKKLKAELTKAKNKGRGKSSQKSKVKEEGETEVPVYAKEQFDGFATFVTRKMKQG